LSCQNCGAPLNVDSKYCAKCGAPVTPGTQGFIMTTTPTVAGYKITRVLGIVSGITPRTRGILGKFIGGIESMIGGEVTAFSSEIEKARSEAIDRLRSKAAAMGANAVIGVDVETTELGQAMSLLVFSATGTAVVLEPEA